MEFLTSKSSLAEERRIWLSRNIKLATRIQNLLARDTIFKCIKGITCDHQAPCAIQTRSASSKQVRPTAADGSRFFFFNFGSYLLSLRSRDHEINWISSNMVSWCCVVIVVFFDDKHTSHFVNNWYLLTFTSLILT